MAQIIRLVARAISGIGFLGAGTFIRWKKPIVGRIILRPHHRPVDDLQAHLLQREEGQVMQLVLVRHGKAEDPAARPSDLERELTTTGRSMVKGMAKGLRLCVSGKAVIWTSPLPRARQTADILANAFKVKKIREHDAIAAGDLDALARDWQTLDPHQPKALILVGHQPHLGSWAERLTGAVLPIKTAAALAVDLDEDGALSGTLRWYAHAKALAGLADR